MRKRVFNKTKKERSIKIDRAKQAALQRAQAALSIDEISRAQSEYARLAFAASDDVIKTTLNIIPFARCATTWAW